MDLNSYGWGIFTMGMIAIGIGRLMDCHKENKLEEYVVKGRCEALVIAMVGEDLAEGWWTSPNRAFGGQTPLNTDLDKVYHYLMGFAGK